ATTQLEIHRRTAAAAITELQEEVALWKVRAERAEVRAERAEVRAERAEARAAELETKIAALQATVKELREEIARLKREGNRSAGRFSKNKRKYPRKRPGRKNGEGRFNRLAAPPESPDTTHVDVPVPGRCDCGGLLELLRYEEASNTDPPRNVHPHVTKFRVP